MACLLCGSTRLMRLYDNVRDRFGIAQEPHHFLRCEDCGSATLDPLPAPETIASLYPSDYTFRPTADAGPHWRRLLGELERWLFYGRSYRQRLAVLQQLTGLRHGRVLEVGCGNGLFLRGLRDEGYEVQGLEMSTGDVAYARERFGLPVIHGTLDSVSLPTEHYDAVVLIYVLEHVLDPRGVVAHIYRLLKPGGWLVLGLPVIDSLQARWLGARWTAVTEAPRHITLPSFEGARRLLSAAVFAEVRTAPCPLLENAGHIALSLVPSAATSCSQSARSLAPILRRIGGGLAIAPAFLVAWAERRGPKHLARAGTTFFCGRR